MEKTNLLKNLNVIGTNIPINSFRNISLFVFEKDQTLLISDIWKMFEKEIPVGLTATWDWISTWIEVYGSLVGYKFILALQNDEITGIALITLETHRTFPFPVRAFHIGTYGEPIKDSMQMTNNRILVKAESRRLFYDVLIEALSNHFKCEEIIFDEMSEHEADVLRNVLQESGYRFNVDTHTMLYADFDKLRQEKKRVQEVFSSSMRYAIRRTIKVFADLEIEWPKNRKDAMNIFEELVGLYNENVKKINRSGKFASNFYIDFQRKLITKFFDNNSIALLRVKSKKYGTLGCFYFIIDKGIAYFTQIGLSDVDTLGIDTISKNRLKIGYLIHALFMEECFNRGLKGYSFSTGVYQYKLQLTNAREYNYTISVKKSFKPILRDKIFKLYTKIDSKRRATFPIRILRFLVNNLSSRLA